MAFLAELWLPIVVSAVGVFIVSSIVHMALPLHKSDYKKLGSEKDVLAGLREHGVTQGEYMFPGADSMKDMGNPDYIAKCDLGPVGYMVILPNGLWNMNKSLMQWFVLSLVIGVFTAYVADFSLVAGASFSHVMRLTGTVATMAYVFGQVTNSIWKGIRWGVTAKFIFDGILYGVTTGLIFAWLWPEGA